MVNMIPKGVTWIKQRVDGVSAERNMLTLNDSTTISYEYLVVAAGMQLDWDKIKGLKESLGKDGVVSNYDYTIASITWQTIKSFKGDKAIFTQPVPPFKCPGTAQKIL